jgi:hypothetical protein
MLELSMNFYSTNQPLVYQPVGLSVGLSHHASGRSRDLLLVSGDAFVDVEVQMLLDDVPDHRMFAIWKNEKLNIFAKTVVVGKLIFEIIHK